MTLASSDPIQTAVPPRSGSHNETNGKSSSLPSNTAVKIPGTLRERTVRGFLLKETIGEGTYGKVKIAVNPATGERIAIKIMAKKALVASQAAEDDASGVGNGGADDRTVVAAATAAAAASARVAADAGYTLASSSLRRLKRELDIHRALFHPNIVRLYDHHEDDTFVYLLMEMAAGGELFDKIVPDVGLDDQLAHFYFRQLVNALVYMHGKGVSHRDLKPENMLIDQHGNLKVSDFGFATVYRHKGTRRTLTTPCGSPPYLAPEVAQCKYDGELCDVWSMGVILYVLLNGAALWDEPTSASPEFVAFVAAHYNGDAPLGAAWDRMPRAPRALALAMLHLPARRLRLAAVAAHPWVIADNPLYNGADGMCADTPLLLRKMYDAMEPVGGASAEEYVISQAWSQQQQLLQHQSQYPTESPAKQTSSPPSAITPARYASFSQPEESATRVTDTFAVSNPIAWFSQPGAGVVSSTTVSGLAGTLQSQLPGLTQPLYPNQLPVSQQLHLPGSEFSPSMRLTRFYTLTPPQTMHRLLLSVLESNLAKCVTVAADGARGCHIAFSTVDRRRCPLLGDIRVQPVLHASLGAWLVLFVRRKGDPIEFKRFFLAMVRQDEIRDVVAEGTAPASASHQ
ncbi:kinase-like domain-containing protein [Blastocladiella britannica]|nr:kinase-like domain-containing protein [Blastocladiella britannica]